MTYSDKCKEFGTAESVKLPYLLVRKDTNHTIKNQIHEGFDFSKMNTIFNPAYLDFSIEKYNETIGAQNRRNTFYY